MGLVGHKQGRSHGYEGFSLFSNERTLQKNGRFSMIGPPFLSYTEWPKNVIKLGHDITDPRIRFNTKLLYNSR